MLGILGWGGQGQIAGHDGTHAVEGWMARSASTHITTVIQTAPAARSWALSGCSARVKARGRPLSPQSCSISAHHAPIQPHLPGAGPGADAGCHYHRLPPLRQRQRRHPKRCRRAPRPAGGRLEGEAAMSSPKQMSLKRVTHGLSLPPPLMCRRPLRARSPPSAEAFLSRLVASPPPARTSLVVTETPPGWR